MAAAQRAYAKEAVAYLTESHTGLYVGSNAKVRAFAEKMRAIHQRGLDQARVEAIDTDENLSLALDDADRQRMPDWRSNPSLVASLIGQTWRVQTAYTRAECLQALADLFEKAGVVEKDAAAQGYSKMLNICEMLRRSPSYLTLVSSLTDVIAMLASSNMLVRKITIDSAGFVAPERPTITSCNAANFVELMRTGQLNQRCGNDAFPFVVSFAEEQALATSNPYLALIYAVCHTLLESVRNRQSAADGIAQLDIVREWAAVISPSEPLDGIPSPQDVIRHTALFLDVYQGTKAVSALFEQVHDLAISSDNPLFALAIAERLRRRFDTVSTLNRVELRESLCAECVSMIPRLLPCDAHIGRDIVEHFGAMNIKPPQKSPPFAPTHLELMDMVRDMFDAYPLI